MRLFITGGTGFIGKHVVRQAIGRGFDVVSLCRDKNAPFVVETAQHVTWVHTPMDEVPADVLAGCDVVLHLAAHSANVPYDTLQNCILWNVQKPLSLFESAVVSGIKKFVVAGSCFEYGSSGASYDFIPPTAPLLPTQTYPASKAMSSVGFAQFCAEKKVYLSYHRVFQVFGEGEAEGRLWPSLRKSALSGNDLDMTAAEQVRDFIPVEWVAEQFLNETMRNDWEPGIPLVKNLGSGKPQRLRDFAEYWWQKWNAKGKLNFGVLPYRSGEIMRYVPEL